MGALVAEAHVNPSALPSQKPLGMLRSANYAGPHAYFDADACSFLPAMGAMNGTEWSVHGVGRVFSAREESAGGHTTDEITIETTHQMICGDQVSTAHGSCKAAVVIINCQVTVV